MESPDVFVDEPNSTERGNAAAAYQRFLTEAVDAESKLSALLKRCKDGEDKTEVASEVKRLAEETHRLQATLNESVSIFTASQIAVGQKRIVSLRNGIASAGNSAAVEVATTQHGVSRAASKFSFRRPAATATSAAPPRGPDGDSSYIERNDSNSPSAGIVEGSPATAIKFHEEFSKTIKGVDGQRFVFAPGSVNGKDCSLRNLTNCSVFLLDRVGALRCTDLENCQIWAPCVETSCLFYECRRCLFGLATKQLRLHDSESILLSVHSLSEPVIERVTNAVFGPICFTIPNREELWRTVGLWVDSSESNAKDCNGLSDKWSGVLDFNWHKRAKSPHWRLSGGDELPPPLSICFANREETRELHSKEAGEDLEDAKRRPVEVLRSLAPLKLSEAEERMVLELERTVKAVGLPPSHALTASLLHRDQDRA